MVLPKVTRQRIYAAKGEALEITIPEGESCAKWRRYAIQAKRGGRRLGTIFVRDVEHRGKQRIATVELADQPVFMAKVSGDTPDPSQSIDPEAEKVPEDFQKKVTAESRERWAERRQAEHSEQVVGEQINRLGARFAKLQREAAKLGVDITPTIQGAITEAQRRIVSERRAA